MIDKNKIKFESMNLNEKIGVNLTVKRIECGLTQQQVADMLRISRCSVVNIERGRQGISIQRLYEFCAALNAKIPDILPNTFNMFF